MRFTPDEDLLALRDSFEKFLDHEIPIDLSRSRYQDPDADLSSVWEKCTEFGLPQYFSDQEEKNLFTALVELTRVAGNRLLPGGVMEQVFAGPFLCGSLASELKEDHEKIISGAARVGIIPGSREAVELFDNESVGAGVAEASSLQFLIALGSNGEIHLIAAPFKPLKESGESVDPSVKREWVKLGKNRQKLSLDGARVAAMQSVLLSAELLGVGQRCVQITKEYVISRKQFGAPVGSFQAVQHQLVNAYADCECLDALVSLAAASIDADHGQQVVAAESALEFACERMPKAAAVSVQLHGGIGFTWEYDLHLFLKRARTIACLNRSTPKQKSEYLERVRERYTRE